MQPPTNQEHIRVRQLLPIRLNHIAGGSEDLRPPRRITQVGLREPGKRVGRTDAVFDHLVGVRVADHGDRDLESPAVANQIRVGESLTIRLDDVHRRIEDLGPPIRIPEIGTSQPGQSIGGLNNVVNQRHRHILWTLRADIRRLARCLSCRRCRRSAGVITVRHGHTGQGLGR
jgi:hypothetical protein